MRISIIIPVYNVETYIVECLESVINQTYDGEMECIIVDDCGQDRSMELAEKLLSNYTGPIDFKILHHEQNRGLSAARNTGIRASTGDYLTFVDSDDKLFPESIARLIQCVHKHPNVDIVQGDIVFDVPKITSTLCAVSGSRFPDYINQRSWINNYFLAFVPVTVWAKLIRLNFLRDQHLMFLEGKLHEDEIWRLYASRVVNDIAFCFHPVYFYRTTNPHSIIHQKDQTLHYSHYLYLIQDTIYNSALEYRPNEIRFIIDGLKYNRKANRWSQICNKKKIRHDIMKITQTAFEVNSNFLIKFMAIYLLFPKWLAYNWVSKRIYNHVIKLLSRKYN